MECVHIHCVQSVYSEYKYGEASVEIDPTRGGERELVFRNYWSQYGHNNATPLSARPTGSTNHLSSLKSTIIDLKELITSEEDVDRENIRYWATEQDLRDEVRAGKITILC